MNIPKHIKENLSLITGSEEAYLVGETVARLKLKKTVKNLAYEDIVRDAADIESHLARMDFTMEAMAWSGKTGLIDPYNAIDHIRSKIIRTVADPFEQLGNKPIAALKAIYLACEYDFTISDEICEAMDKYSHALKDADIIEIRTIFVKILRSTNASAGLKFLLHYNMMDILLGGGWQDRMNKINKENFEVLIERINETSNDPLTRLSLLLSCLNVESARKSVNHLNFEGQDKVLLSGALTEVDRLYFIGNKLELKRCMNRLGLDAYTIYNNIAIEQNRIFDRADIKAEARGYMLEDILANKEPIFVEDLKVNENDMIINELAMNASEARDLLEMLLDLAHINPKINRKEYLLLEARKIKINPLKKLFRKVAWHK